VTTTDLRAVNSIARARKRAADIAQVERLKATGMSNVEIGKEMGINESSVRALLAPGAKMKTDVLETTASMLKNEVDNKGFIDVGAGVEHHVGVSAVRLNTAVSMLKAEGYELHNVQVQQLGTPHKTLVKVLCPPGTTYRDVVTNMEKVTQIANFTDDGGFSYRMIKDPLSVSSKRVEVIYAEQGGDKADGMIYVRPGVDDISLGGSRYAQVRIAVNGTHYLKGMAVYKDDLPDGVDLQFHTNKKNTGDKLAAMKAMKDDPENPFGAVVRQIQDKDGNVISAMNKVNEEGTWDTWSRNLSSQTLSKQTPELAKTQLDMTFERRKAELDEIMSLTNPAVRQKLLDAFSESVDAAAVKLKAAALPRSSWHVLLPVNSLKENEIFAPNFKDGESVALIRYPHGGRFEIPELKVNNRNAGAIKAIGKQAKDAVGINSEVAKRLSGADFDGDAVLVIPNNSGKIKTSTALQGLKDFDPQIAYPGYEGMSKMDAQTKGREMGRISNLITDMTIRGANNAELAAAVRHSMVVIDAEKHGLNWKLSAEKNGISHLMQKYQGKPQGGAATLISRATARTDVPARKQSTRIDPATGRKIVTPTGESWQDPKTGKTVFRTQRSVKLRETDDAHTLSSGTRIEQIYADHSNRLKSMANEARRAMVNTKTIPYDPSAAKTYKPEVDALTAKLRIAEKNRPLERQAQIIGNAAYQAKLRSNPNMDPTEKKRAKFIALEEARMRTGAGKELVEITPREWEAIQAGAVSNNRLRDILNNTDIDRVKELATPRKPTVMTSTVLTRAKQMAASGYTQAEIAEHLGVALSTLKSGLER
jgi:DNA-binding CsgD family transcriptional regulator